MKLVASTCGATSGGTVMIPSLIQNSAVWPNAAPAQASARPAEKNHRFIKFSTRSTYYGGTIVMVSGTSTKRAPTSVIRTTVSNTPVLVGVPDSKPVLDSCRPGGRPGEPGASVQVKGGEPPLPSS